MRHIYATYTTDKPHSCPAQTGNTRQRSFNSATSIEGRQGNTRLIRIFWGIIGLLIFWSIGRYEHSFMSESCANPLLLGWIKEWLDQARERNSKGFTVFVSFSWYISIKVGG